MEIDQGIEADIERLLKDDGKEESVMEGELERLRVMREEKRRHVG